MSVRNFPGSIPESAPTQRRLLFGAATFGIVERGRREHRIAASIKYPDTYLFHMETFGGFSMFIYECSESCFK